MDNLTALILAHIDYGSLIAIALAVGLGLLAYEVLALIFSGAHEAISGMTADDECNPEEDD